MILEQNFFTNLVLFNHSINHVMNRLNYGQVFSMQIFKLLSLSILSIGISQHVVAHDMSGWSGRITHRLKITARKNSITE